MSDDQHHNLEEQEREEILEEIDKLVSTNRLPATDTAEKLKPQKSGLAFPVVINLIAVAAVLSTFYFSNRLFEQRQETLSIENATYQSAEGKLLEELKRESDEKLRAKEDEINSINNELAELDRQSRELVENMDQQVAEREAVLREALEAELEEERQKLRAEGRSETDIEEELRRIEQQRTAEYEAELAAFRNETERQIAEKEEELARARALNQELLAEVNSEKERIQDETRQRESELTAQFEAEKAALAEEAAEAEAQLEKLTADRERETLIVDQINGTYESIFDLLEDGKTEEALAQVDALQTIIDDPSVAALNAVRERSANDRSMIDIIRQKVEEQAYKEDVDTQSLTEAADLLLSAQEIAGLGTQAFSSGRLADAADYYTRSLEKIPALKQAWENLGIIERNDENSRLSSLLEESRSLESEGRYREAASKYAEAASAAASRNPALLGQAVSGILSMTETAEEIALSNKDTAFNRLKTESTDEIETLKKQLEDNENDFTFRLSQANTDWENRLAEAAADYDGRVAAAEEDYNSKLLDADTSRTAIETEKNDEIERLTRLIGERDQENLRLNAEKEETEAALAEARQTITDGEAYIAGLQANAEAETAALQEEIDQLKKTIEESTLGSELAAANDKVRELEAELDQAKLLETELVDVKQAYEELLESSELGEENIASRLRASEMTGYNNGLEQGRTEAMQDILEFASYLDGSSELDAEARAKIAELSSNETYQEAVRKIQDIAETGAETAADKTALTESRGILIGSITYASGNQIIIEPLADIEIESGSRITIMRRERGKPEKYITYGIVTSVSNGRITARTDPAGIEPAWSMDLVYLNQ